MTFDYSDVHGYPKVKLGSTCELAGDAYTVVKVAPKGGTAVLRHADGREVKVRRRRAARGPIPRELSKLDVDVIYVDEQGRRAR